MIKRDDVLYLEYLKKSEYTGSHQGMRYRLEGVMVGEEKKLRAIVWPEPLNFFKTKEELKQSADFSFSEDGITDAVAWMNDCLFDMRK